ncbi:MAG TPA: hypothetical protein VK939_18030 [Longimicrobiales bacterium]|nr:hypothetical protein [Longimicrobiales bacterium]
MKASRALLAALALTVLAGAITPAAAIPAFARKYRVSCSLCHSAAPKLTAFGENFAANGFEIAPGEVPVDTIATPDPLLRLQRDLPLAVRFDAFAQLLTGMPGDATSVDLQTPWGIKLLSGGQIADRISYYMYFFLTERGEVSGLEDAYVQFTDLARTGVNLMVGQFQISDPLFKRELRLSVEDYQPYRIRVGEAAADLTYDRGFMATWSPLEGTDIALLLVNGFGLRAADESRTYDNDNWKNVAARISQDVGPLRIGAFGYLANEERDDIIDEIRIYGPDATLALGRFGELNAQFLRRTDDDPFFLGPLISAETTVDAALAELVLWPQGENGRLFLTGIFNWIDADAPLVTLRAGELSPLERYRYGAGNLSWLVQRNLRLMGEAGRDFEADVWRFTLGFTAAF